MNFEVFLQGFSDSPGQLPAPFQRPPDVAPSGVFSGSQLKLTIAHEHRFMPRFTLHYPEFTGMGVTPADAT